MRSIEVSTQVFSLIWAARQQGEEDEDTILKRLLSQDEQQPESQKTATSEPRRRSSVLWRDDIVDGLSRLGGEADLNEIYRVVKGIRKKAGRTIPRSVDAVIRRELENNSSDSESFTGHRNLFRSVNGIGGGRWALR